MSSGLHACTQTHNSEISCRIIYFPFSFGKNNERSVSAHLHPPTNNAGQRGAFYGFKEIFIILFYVYMCFAHTYIWGAHACNLHRGQRRVADPLGPELQMVVSCAVVAGFLNPGSMEEQPVFLPTELSLQPWVPFVFCAPDSRGLGSWRLISSTYRFLLFSPESPSNFLYMAFL